MATVGVGISSEQAASVSTAPAVSELTTTERKNVNRAFGSDLDKNLDRELTASLGTSLDSRSLLALGGALKHSIRSRLTFALGLGGNTGAGPGASVSAGTPASTGVTLGGVGGIQGGASLGASLGTKASPTAGADTLAGVRIGGGVSASSVAGLTSGLEGSATASSTAQAQLRLSATADLKVSLSAMLDAAFVGAGISAEKAAALKAEIGPEIDEALDRSFRSAFGPDPGFPHAAGALLLGSEVTMPSQGEWTAMVETDVDDQDETPPTGPYWFDIDGVEFRGTVQPARSGAFGGRMKLRVIGGAGGLGTPLAPRNYAGRIIRVKTVVDDILRDSGETLSGESDAALLDRQLPGWQRAAGPGRDALTKVLEREGATWRVLRDGTVWVGTDSWPEVEPDGDAIDLDWGDGLIVWAPDHPTMVPGVVVRGQRVEQVVHRLEPAGLRTELHSRSIQSSLKRAMMKQTTDTDYTKRWRCRVVRQNGNGSVDVLIDDERMRARGVGQCRVRVGIPGTTLKVPSGARCLVGWDDGDPALPHVDGWESGAKFEKISVGDDPRPVARIGDGGRGFLSPGTPVSGTLSGNPFVGVLTVLTPIMFIIESGSNAMDVGNAP